MFPFVFILSKTPTEVCAPHRKLVKSGLGNETNKIMSMIDFGCMLGLFCLGFWQVEMQNLHKKVEGTSYDVEYSLK